MYKHILILVALLLSLTFTCNAQEYKVESFTIVPEDLSARTNPRVDNNGKKCALLKLYVNDKVSEIRGNIIGEIMSSGLENSFYVSDGSKQLEILFENHYPLHIVFDDYNIPALTGAMTYVLRLSSEGEMQSQKFSNTEDNFQINEVTEEAIKNSFREKDYNKCYQLSIQNPENPIAQYYLGVLYHNGFGIDNNYQEAVKWYKKSAAQGNEMAMNNLGSLYQGGKGVNQSMKEALKWYLKAADKDFAPSITSVGYFYEDGVGGLKQSYEEALKWYLKAANLGYPIACKQVARVYFDGLGVKRDYSEALKWYKKAAEQNDTDAMIKAGDIYEKGLGMEVDLSMALNWYKKAADLGNSNAMNLVGLMYDQGKGVSKDLAVSFNWFLKSAKSGNPEGMSYVGDYYKYGLGGVEKNISEAKKWYKKAADLGNKSAEWKYKNEVANDILHKKSK